MLAILSLCDFTGAWSKPYRDAGYDVVQLDIKHGHDVRLFEALPYPVRGVLAAPPCTHLAVSGARWWADKGEQALLDAMAVVDACLRIVAVHRPQWWALENPADYGDPYTKKTLLWGDFSIPRKKPVEATEGSKMHRLPPSPERAALRSVTPEGFSRAFYEANP
jgi:hypothetical protein